MSTFSDTKPTGRIRHFVGVLSTALIAYAVAAGGFEFLINHRAANTANREVVALHGEVIEKLVADAKKKLPKGEKPDNAALEKAAEARFESDAKVKADFEKKAGEARHHAEGGLFPLACFFAISSGLLGGLFGSILLIKRNKDAGVGAWTAFLGHIPSFAFYALVAFLPVLGYLSHHEGVGIVEYLIPAIGSKESLGFVGFVMAFTAVGIGAILAVIGAFVNLVLCVLPSRKGGCDDDHHHGDDHGHGEGCCGHSH